MLRAQKWLRPRAVSVERGKDQETSHSAGSPWCQAEQARGEEHLAGCADWRRGGGGGGEVGGEKPSGGDGAGAEP